MRVEKVLNTSGQNTVKLLEEVYFQTNQCTLSQICVAKPCHMEPNIPYRLGQFVIKCEVVGIFGENLVNLHF